MFQGIAHIFGLLFAPLHAYEPAGMFTLPHFLLLGVSAAGIIFTLRLCRHIKWQTLTRRFAVALTVLEAVKIFYNLKNGYTWPDAWVPLSFCSLFLYALWMTGYGGGWVKRWGSAFLCYGAITGGAAFLAVPTTSLMNYPAWHFLCLYSMLYHSVMVCLGVQYLRGLPERPGGRQYGEFAAFFGISALFCVFLNGILGSNFMILREPYHIPVAAVRRLYEACPPAYTMLAAAACLLIPGAVTTALYPVLHRSR